MCRIDLINHIYDLCGQKIAKFLWKNIRGAGMRNLKIEHVRCKDHETKY